MGWLQELLDAEVQNVPRRVCTILIDEKLAALGIKDAGLTERFVAHILDGADLELEDDSPAASLEFSEKDHPRLEELGAKITSTLAELAEKLPEKAGRDILEGLKADWPARELNDHAEMDAFKKRLGERWYAPLSKLRLLLQLSRDLGGEFNLAHVTSTLKRDRHLNEALGRLHNRGCQVTAEIITLLENGFSEGAYTRWRTLLELMVSAVLIVEGGDALAERFLAYEAVDRKRTMDEHDRCAALTGEPPTREKEAKAINKAFERVKRQFGDEMKESYGWIAGQLSLPMRPNFSQMQDLAGSMPFRLYYKLASFGVHVTPQGSVTQNMIDAGTRIAGASNAGLEYPGANTAHTLTRLTSLLFREPWDQDQLALARSILLLRDEIDEAFHAEARRLERDEEKSRSNQVKRALRAPRKALDVATRPSI